MDHLDAAASRYRARGLRLTLDGVAAIGMVAIPIVIVCIAVAFGASILLGRCLRVTVPLRQLIAVGTAVCGCTAIAAAAPIVRAKPEQTGLALTCIVLFGCLAMLIYPWLAHSMFGGSGLASGVFLGTAIHDTSQVIGASLIYGQQFNAPETVAVAGATKLLRNISLLMLIPLLARTTRGLAPSTSPSRHWPRWLDALPGFLIAFIAFAVLRFVADNVFLGSPHRESWLALLSATLTASDLLLVCGMAAIGLNVSLKQVVALGWRTPALAFMVALLVALASLALTAGLVALR